jgi:hypothetical protein
VEVAREEAMVMAVEVHETGEDTASGGASLGVVATDSGCVLPLVHTFINAEVVTERGGHRVLLTIDATEVETPPLEHLAFYAGLGVMVGVGLIEPPIALALGVGHLLLDLTRRPGLQALGEALEEA